jgi:hypothetical protein
MLRTVWAARILAGLLIAFGFVGLRVSAALATTAPTATVIIHKAECPTGVGGDIFEECHDNGLGGVDFLIADAEGDQVVTTDADGVASAEVIAGEVSITEDPDVLADYLGAYVYCSEQNSGEVLIDIDLDGDDTVGGEIEAGDEVVCDWYNITEADDDDDGGDDDDDGGDDDDDNGGTTLPDTGVGFGGGSSDAVLLLTLGLSALALGGTALGLRRRTAL